MCQAVLSPNLTKKFQWKVSQIANNRFPLVMLLGGSSVDLNHLTKNGILDYILLHIYANLWLKIPKFGGSEKIGNFLTSQKLPLYGPANGQSVTYSKIHIKVSRTP